jgi:hypothetical protein
MIKSLAFAAALTALLSGSALAHDAPGGEEGAKVTLVYDHKLPNVPGKSMKGVLVEYAPGGFSEGWPYTSSVRLHIRDRSRRRDPQSGQRWPRHCLWRG